LPQGADFDGFALAFAAYRALRRAGLSIDVLPPGADLAPYAAVLAPGIASLSPALRAGLAAAPGIALVGPRSGAQTEEMAVADGAPGLPGLDLRVTEVESLPPGAALPVHGGGAVIRWRERVEGRAPLRMATADGEALVLGERLRYLGGWPDDALWDRLVAGILAETGVAAEPVAGGLRLRDAGRRRFAFNYGPEPAEWSGRTLPTGAVAWTPADGRG
jgi:beta-galactosidase